MARKPKAKFEGPESISESTSPPPGIDQAPEDLSDQGEIFDGEIVDGEIGETAEPIIVPDLLEIKLRIPVDRSVLTRPGYVGRRHDIKMNESQAKALRCVTFALDQMEEKTRSGKPIRMRGSYAIEWILDQLTAAVLTEAGKEKP